MKKLVYKILLHLKILEKTIFNIIERIIKVKKMMIVKKKFIISIIADNLILKSLFF